MASATVTQLSDDSYGDLLKRLGRVSPARVILSPAPGTATEDDLLDRLHRDHRLYELIEGTIVEKVYGLLDEGVVSTLLGTLTAFVLPKKIGVVFDACAPMRMKSGSIRLPDLSFLSWKQIPDRSMLNRFIVDISPDLAVEVLPTKITKAEITLRLREYFAGGTRLAWVIDPREQTARVHTAPTESILVTEDGSLDGGEVLPGFSMPLGKLFENLPKA